jgi:hypothetical protein
MILGQSTSSALCSGGSSQRRLRIGTHVIIAGCTFLLAWAVPPSAALAQKKVDPAAKAAGARFDEGLKAYDKGDYESARLSFLQALTLKRHPTVVLNLGLSSVKAKHYSEGARYLEEYLREGTGAEDKKAEAKRVLAEAYTNLVRVDVQAANGVEVRLGNELLGVTPLKDALAVDPGASLAAKLPDGSEQSFKASSAAGTRASWRIEARGAEPKTEPAKVEPTKVEPAKVEPAKVEPAKVEPTKVDQPEPTKSAMTFDEKDTKPGLLAPPSNLVPVFVGVGVGVVGTGMAIAFAVAKSSAAKNATTVENQIKQARLADGVSDPRGTCVSTDRDLVARYSKACSTLQTNIDRANTNQTISTVSLIAGIAGFVFAGGYYLLANKKQPSSSARKRSTFGVAPTASQEGIGLLLQGAF